MFDINLDEVEISLSFMRWLDGKGLVREAKVKGVRGVIGRFYRWLYHVADKQIAVQCGGTIPNLLSRQTFAIQLVQATSSWNR
jgi:hypothetical protein